MNSHSASPAEPAGTAPVAGRAPEAGARVEAGSTSPSTPAGARVELIEVVKTFALGGGRRLRATDAISLTVEAGHHVALVGASGSGKSTLLHLVGAMEAPDSGAIVVGGTALGGLRPRQLAAYRRGVGFVFQRFHLLPALTVLDNVLAPLVPVRHGTDKRARAREVLAAVGLADREGALPADLSGGEQQRVAIARALVARPRLVLADEPTGNLDSATGAEILELLLGLQREHGTTVILATHDPAVAARCDRVVRLADGAVVEDVRVTAYSEAGSLLEQIARLRGS